LDSLLCVVTKAEALFRVRFQQASPFAGWTAPLAARLRVAGDLPPIG
jgi:hypothetical protein